ncbi:diacylglycerol kinase family protein [Levilactobacillus bambusae]|uniref:UDP kinase n=1 Tax=Levilactobacillus bambusae TaxID=2024736 RepID=A0A2V1N0H7_9LACO|nr:diacylglycerol kinase family protein [Levilactobacillus bambusae]PWG00771.1 UDP kinase [Levilactobacillus bambusae]
MDSNEKKTQTTKNHTFWQSFCHAKDGLVALYQTERNFRKHTLAAILAIGIGVWLHLTMNQWLWLLLAIFLVFISEAVNTIVESIVDLLVGHQFDGLAKKAKDVAAAGVLMAAAFAVVVGLLILAPSIWNLLQK